MNRLFEEIEVPQQKRYYEGFPLPYVLSPKQPCSSLTELIDSIKVEKPYLESLLHSSGALLLRGFPVNTASDFNDVVEAFGYEEFIYLGGEAPRTHIVGRVYTANEAPLHLSVGFHHEMSYLSEFPSKLLFFCQVEPSSGGETPIVRSNIVYERIKQKHPDFVQRLEECGVTYIKVTGEDDDPSNPTGRGWKSRFSTDDKRVAEERANKVGIKLEWLENNRVRTIMGPMPAIRYDKSRNQKIWCNSIAVTYPMVENGYEFTLTFGDGKPLPAEIISSCLSILEEESVAIPWQKGDILLVDNWAILHARRSSIPPRRVLASLCK